LWLPIAGTIFSAAVPALVNCAAPRTWISVQNAAAASQNFTCPVVTGAAPALTVAVRVTTLPGATVVTALPPDVTARAVVVAEAADQAGSPDTEMVIPMDAEIKNWQWGLTFSDYLSSSRGSTYAILTRRNQERCNRGHTKRAKGPGRTSALFAFGGAVFRIRDYN